MTRRVLAEALERSYEVTRRGRRDGVATRIEPSGTASQLARSARRLGFDGVGLAAAVLEDALGSRPHHRLARDLSLFLVPPGAGTRRMTGHELQDWLETWRPPLEQLLPVSELRRLRRGPRARR